MDISIQKYMGVWMCAPRVAPLVGSAQTIQRMGRRKKSYYNALAAVMARKMKGITSIGASGITQRNEVAP
jgi:hypothetical protein